MTIVKKRLKDLFNKNHGVLTFQELNQFGLTHYAIKKLIKEGLVERVKRGRYTISEIEEDEYFLAQQITSSGIYCLYTAASIHNYTTYIPNEYDLAIKSNYSPNLPEYPRIKLYYWRKKQYELGRILLSPNESNIWVYDKEKTVCDFLKFRNKIDRNIVKEVLRGYLNDKERDLVKLKKYSKELKIESILNQYLEILL